MLISSSGLFRFIMILLVIIVVFFVSIYYMSSDLQILVNKSVFHVYNIGSINNDNFMRKIKLKNDFNHDISIFYEDGSGGVFLGNISPNTVLEVNSVSGQIIFASDPASNGFERLAFAYVRPEIDVYSFHQTDGINPNELNERHPHRSINANRRGNRHEHGRHAHHMANRIQEYRDNEENQDNSNNGPVSAEDNQDPRLVKSLKQINREDKYKNTPPVFKDHVNGHEPKSQQGPQSSEDSSTRGAPNVHDHSKNTVNDHSLHHYNKRLNEYPGDNIQHSDVHEPLVPSVLHINPNFTLDVEARSRPHPAVKPLRPHEKASNAMSARFRSLSAKKIDLWYNDGKDGTPQAFLGPGQTTATNSYVGHEFYATYAHDKSIELTRFRVSPDKVEKQD